MARLDIKDEYKGCHATELARYQQLVGFLLKNPQGVTRPQLAEALDMQLKNTYSLIHNEFINSTSTFILGKKNRFSNKGLVIGQAIVLKAYLYTSPAKYLLA